LSQFGGSESGSDGDDNEDTLPFPKPIDRSSFSDPNFDATTFLSGLHNRFQTLEDLQTELRGLSQALNKELVDLVNDNYQDFLSLGSTLSGGEERIEDIRVGLFGFQREVKALRDKVDTRREEVRNLFLKKKALGQETSLARVLLEVSERLDELEEKLSINRTKSADIALSENHDGRDTKWSTNWTNDLDNDSDDDYDSDDSSALPPRLKRRTEDFFILRQLLARFASHPYIVAQGVRKRKLQDLLLSHYDVAIKQEPEVKRKQQMLQIRSQVED
jgi:hypothetical protein